MSPEFVGPYRNGGVGTAYTTLAQILAQAGHEVTVLYTGSESIESGSLEQWKKHYLSQGILLFEHTSPPGISVESPPYVKKSYEIFLWLSGNQDRFDIVHFPELLGQAYYSVLAKRQGISFEKVSFCVGVHSSTKWVELGNQRLFSQPAQLDADFLERESVRLADVVLSPSQYLLRWMQQDGWRFPEQVYVCPYAVPPELYNFNEKESRTRGRSARRGSIQELVFFGRLEPRKGLVIFCDAIDRLVTLLGERQLRVTFMGKPSLVNGENATHYIASRSRNWGLQTQILTKDRSEALSYLREHPGLLVVIPSVLDNFPNTVLECLAVRIPFIASDVGGIPEQIRPDHRQRILFTPRADCLAAKIAETVETEPMAGEPSFDFRGSNETLAKWHEQFIPAVRRVSEGLLRDRPLVSVCLIHFNRPVFLRWALESLRKQNQNWPFEVILVDDGSTSEEAKEYLEHLEREFQRRNWRIVRQPNSYVGAARNAAVRHSRGKYLLFMDDDNYAEPNEIGILAAVAERTGADILTCVSRVLTANEFPDKAIVKPERHLVPMGAALESGLFWNAFGDANALVRREVFDSLGGFVEVHGTSGEDWEFFARAVLSGFDLQVVPLPLFRYRVHGESISRTTSAAANYFLAMKPYLERDHLSLPGITLMTLGHKLELERWTNGGSQTANGAGLGAGLLSEIDSLWNSRSWKLLRPLRNIHRRWKGLPAEVKPVPHSSNDAAQVIIGLRSSLSWELTSPIRLAHRIITRSRRDKSRTDGQ